MVVSAGFQSDSPQAVSIPVRDLPRVRADVANEVLAHIRAWMQARNLSLPTDLDRTFVEAGFDSLHAVELGLFLERKLGKPIDEASLYDLPTFASLIAYLVDRAEE
ncbi:acyl carrier protein [Paraburkholderia flava]|uniref:acyl carrier protein n=1 Tax=Paraburkholderia flava TaxID=2547393 RepID=UPI0010619B8F|nr:acyl carrier protein [Paraburkholderia flava]